MDGGDDVPFSGLGYQTWGATPEALDDCLNQLADAGFTSAEFGVSEGPDGWDLLIGGRVNGRQLARLVDVVDKHRDRMRFTLHGPGAANLFDLGNADLHRKLLCGGLEIARAIGAEVMVMHAGQRRPWPAGSTSTMVELLAREREALLVLAEEASASGGAIAIETWMPFGDYSRWGYSYAEWPDQLAAQIEAVGHPSLGVCLDTGHLYAAAQWYGFDLNNAVARLAPLVNHVHVQDNAGRMPAAAGFSDLGLGVGRHFVPPGWGEIPLSDLLTAVEFPRQPALLLQLPGNHYRNELSEFAEELRRLTANRET
jgi:sugar phosphate isomerase/epimerase